MGIRARGSALKEPTLHPSIPYIHPNLLKPPPKFAKSKAVEKPHGYNVTATTAWSAFINEAAKGLSPSGLAKMFGLTIRKVERLLMNDEVKAQITEASRRLSKVGDYARNKLLSAAPDLIEAQLEVALGRQPALDKDDRPMLNENGEPLTRWEYDVRERMLAGRYCLDKILPTITKVEMDSGAALSQDLALALRDNLEALRKLPPTPSVLLSPHVHNGKDAVPRAIDVSYEVKE